MTARHAGILAALLLAVGLAAAGLIRAAASDPTPTFEERVAAVAETIRCPTCNGLSIHDSPSVLADGSRQIVEEQLQQGRSPDEVRAYFVSRYGPSAVLTPDTGGVGLLAWLLPVVGLPAAGWYGWRRLRGPLRGVAGPHDADAETALAGHRSGALVPDPSPAGEALREALTVRLAAQDDGLEPAALARADARLGAAYRRYTRRVDARRRRPGPVLPRRAITILTVLALLAGTGTALAVGVRSRGAGDLPTGDLPGGPAADAGLGALLTATRERPEDPGAWIALGRAYDGAEELTSALRAYDRALTLRPSDDVQLLRAGVLVGGGSIGEALPVLE